MQRWLAVGVAVILLVAGGYVWTRGSAPRGGALAAAMPVTGAGLPAIPDDPLVAPVSDVTPADREARRFNRFDKDKDGAVTRDEYLATRRKAYARLDVDGDGSLSFDEYSAKTTKKFNTADLNRDKQLASAEFATTAAKRRARPAACPPADAAQGDAPRDDEG